MAKILFQIRDSNKDSLPKASLAMSCKFRNGEPFSSERLTADNSGRLGLELDNSLLKRIDWDTLVLDIRHKGKKQEYQASKPRKVSPGVFQVMVTVPVAAPSHDDRTERKEETILVVVSDQNKKPVAGAVVTLDWKDARGEARKLESKMGDKGQALIVMDAGEFAAAPWKSGSGFQVTHKSRKFSGLHRNGPRPRTSPTHQHRLDLTVTEIIAEEPDDPKETLIEVFLFNDKKKAVPNAEVTASWKGEDGKQSLNFKTDDRGKGQIQLTGEAIGRVPWNQVDFKVINPADKFGLVAFEGPRQESGDSAFRLDLVATFIGEGDLVERPTRDSGFEVFGTLNSDDGRPQGGLSVRAYDKGIGREQLLGTTLSGKSGKFSIPYTKKNLLRPENGKANLIVRAFADPNAKKPLAASQLRENAPRQLRVNLVLDRSVYRGSSLFDRISQKIAELGLGEKLNKLDLDDAQLIAKELGLDKVTVTQFIQASRLASDATSGHPAAIPPEPVFGVTRVGVGPAAAEFGSIRDSKLKPSVEEALQENWIDGWEVQQAIDAMRPLRAKLLVESGDDWVSALRSNGATNVQIKNVAEAYLKSDVAMNELIQRMVESGQLPKKAGDSMGQALELFEFAGRNPEFLRGLTDDYGIARAIDLAGLAPKDWLAIVGKYFKEMPDWVEGDTPAEQRSNLAHELQCRVEKSFPTRVFSNAWKRDAEMKNQPVQSYLEKAPAFDFASDRLEAYWEKQDRKPQETAAKLLLRTEALFHITPDCQRFPAFKILWQTEIESARDVVGMGRGRFVELMVRLRMAEDVAGEIFRRAQRVSSRGVLARVPVPISLPDADAKPDDRPVTVQPTIATLFGGQGGSGCDHCLSAFSPSAYLIDLLRFLERARVGDRGKDGLALLFERRPDIANLRVDCENSHTPMPYIDLVNELLEHIVATSSKPFRVPAQWKIGEDLDLQTEWSASELAAQPEHLNARAYKRLQGVSAPWSLPYNLWADEVRTYLAQIGIDRAGLMEALKSSPPESSQLKAIALERLRVDPAELEVLTTPAESGAHREKIWQVANPAKDLKNLQQFLRRCGLSYDEASDILATDFVNPKGHQILPTADRPSDPTGQRPVALSDPSKAELNLNRGDANDLLDRFHRFTRLWRRTGWESIELDAVLQSVTRGVLNKDTLGAIGIVAQIHSEFGTPIEEIAAWFGNLNTTGGRHSPSLYERTFLNGSLSGIQDDAGAELLEVVFKIQGNGGQLDLAVTKSTTRDKWLARRPGGDATGEPELHSLYAPIVTAACRISAAELLAMIAEGALPGTQGEIRLNLANLSKIFSLASRARALRITLEEYLDWLRVLGTGISNRPADTHRVMRRIADLTDAKITAGQLAYGIAGRQVDGVSPADGTIDALAETLRAELLKATEDIKQDPPSPVGQLEDWLTLASGLVEDDLTAVMAILAGSAEFDPAHATTLGFISSENTDRLFGDQRLKKKEERLALAAGDIPIDLEPLPQISEILMQDPALEEAEIAELRAIMVDPAAAANGFARVGELLPYLDHLDLAGLDASERMPVLRRELLEHWVRGPIVVRHLAAAAAIPERSVELLSNAVPAGAKPLVPLLLGAEFLGGTAAALAAAREGLARLFHQAALVNSIGLDPAGIEFANRHSSGAGLFDFAKSGNSQDIAEWPANVALHLTNSAVRGDESLYDILAAILDDGIDAAGAFSRLAALFGVTAVDLKKLAGPDGLAMNFPEDFVNADRMQALHRTCELLKLARIDAAQLVQLTHGDLEAEQANIAKGAVRSHYGQHNWLEVSEKLRSGIRERQRDALLGFVRTRGGKDLSHEQAYAYYLIDVDMGACFETSRTKQAIASVQQFIQRILLGLEFDGPPAADQSLTFLKEDSDEWVWRRNYRVWEANVKVFVYPENWLEPELRDNKTPFFRELEQELMQGELDANLADSAVTGYLAKLHDAADLEIINLYDDHTTELVYAIGRTHNLPHQYYLRTWNHEIWSPWEKIEAEIEGDHVVPVVYYDQLYLFWPTFTEEVNEEKLEAHPITEEISALENRIGEIDTLIDGYNQKIGEYSDLLDDPLLGGVARQLIETFENLVIEQNEIKKEIELRLKEKEREHETIKKQLTYLTIELNWISQGHAGWGGKKLSIGMLTGPEGVGRDHYRFAARTSGSSRLVIDVHTAKLRFNPFTPGSVIRWEDQRIGIFEMDDSLGDFLAIDIEDITLGEDAWRVFDSSFLLHSHHRINCESGPVEISASDDVLLNDPPFDYMWAVTTSRAGADVRHFFLSDEKRTFFVSAKEAQGKVAAPPQRLVKDMEGVKARDSQFVNRRSADSLRQLKNDAARNVGGHENAVSAIVARRESEDATSSKITISRLKYSFEGHYHPFAKVFLRQVRRFGVTGLYAPDRDEHPSPDTPKLIRQKAANHRFDFDANYRPNRSIVEGKPGETIDFSFGSAYGQYNWETFFHVPILIAVRLMQNRKFEEAREWFHYIFDPTETGKGLQKYWKIKPFYEAQELGQASADLDGQLENVAENEAMGLESMIEQWEDNPFQPHAIARFRILAYMRMTVMKYLDNLIAWGDSLFRQDSMESINEATQIYILAANILGERPLIIDEPERSEPGLTIGEYLQGFTLKKVPQSKKIPRPRGGVKGGGAQGILGVLDEFCLPYNDRMLDYWDTVGDRLFKIRNCLNIDGVFRKLPLFQPPIDPALLVNAAAAGVDLSAVLSNLSAPRSHYRFNYLVAKSSELVSQAQSLGSQLLSAMEKRDAEEIARIRSEHEVALLKMNKESRKLAIKEAEETIHGLRIGKDSLEFRRDFYRDRTRVSPEEVMVDLLNGGAMALEVASGVALSIAGGAKLIPDLIAGGAGIASPVAVAEAAGGDKISGSAELAAGILKLLATTARETSSVVNNVSHRQRRNEEWDFFADQTRIDIKQAEKQIAAAEIRQAMAESDLAAHEKQMDHAEEAKAFLKGKFTSKELYSWMVSQLSTLYFQTYQLAFDMAKQAERCYQYELGTPATNFIQFGYWDSLRKGLLAGERLQLDLRRMESSYLNNNRRELELSKSISLAQLDPSALLRLQSTGECYVDLPDFVFDLDYPGHYFRRIKSVSLTVPAVTGPYTTLSSTLTLLSNRYRPEPTLGDGEENFRADVGAIESIATSRGQSDSGLFQLDFRDERYLPFEGAGAISSWRLTLPDPKIAQFDYQTISDVILTINYTARSGGDGYREQVSNRLKEQSDSFMENGANLLQMFSVRQDFSNVWSRFAEDPETSGMDTLPLDLSIDRFPFFVRHRGVQIKAVQIFAVPAKVTQNQTTDDSSPDDQDSLDVSNIGSAGLKSSDGEDMLELTTPLPASGSSATPDHASFAVDSETNLATALLTFSQPIAPGAYDLALPDLDRALLRHSIKDLIVVCSYSAATVDSSNGGA